MAGTLGVSEEGAGETENSGTDSKTVQVSLCNEGVHLPRAHCRELSGTTRNREVDGSGRLSCTQNKEGSQDILGAHRLLQEVCAMLRLTGRTADRTDQE